MQGVQEREWVYRKGTARCMYRHRVYSAGMGHRTGHLFKETVKMCCKNSEGGPVRTGYERKSGLDADV